jgi:hypothetical protein
MTTTKECNKVNKSTDTLTKHEQNVLHSLTITPNGVFNSHSTNGWIYGDMKETVFYLNRLVEKGFATRSGSNYSYIKDPTE